MRLKGILSIGIFLIVLWLLWQSYPYLLFKVTEWQREFNLTLSASLNHLKQHRQQAGLSLTLISFLYGVFHAVGPGHGKFILTSYFSFEQTKLPQAIKLTLLSAFMQGLVAIGLVTIIVGIFTLSRSYFNLTLKWVERGSFTIMLLFGLYWIYQSRSLWSRKRAKKPKILQISPLNSALVQTPMKLNTNCDHPQNCQCGHKHLPTAKEMAQATDWRSQLMLILSIGLRPCSGAILVLFLAYTLDLYFWGMFSALLMALGTGLTLTLFACLVLFTRQKALKLGKWYFSTTTNQQLGLWLKCLMGGVLIFLAITLLHSSWLDNAPNMLFKR